LKYEEMLKYAIRRPRARLDLTDHRKSMVPLGAYMPDDLLDRIRAMQAHIQEYVIVEDWWDEANPVSRDVRLALVPERFRSNYRNKLVTTLRRLRQDLDAHATDTISTEELERYITSQEQAGVVLFQMIEADIADATGESGTAIARADLDRLSANLDAAGRKAEFYEAITDRFGSLGGALVSFVDLFTAALKNLPLIAVGLAAIGVIMYARGRKPR